MVYEEETFQSAIRQLLPLIESVTEETFPSLALRVFQLQARFNPLYAEYLRLLRVQPDDIRHLEEIPFLPIQLFKNYDIKTGAWPTARIFSSSGTTGSATSKHHLFNEDFYRRNARRGFHFFYKNIEKYTLLALLPAYLERTGSSLVFMADDFIKATKDECSGFYLHNQEELVQQMEYLQKNTQKEILLLGVSFALWELAERYELSGERLTVVETGGMKGRRRELTREELHRILKPAFGQTHIHSEYGMTELLSQAWSQGDGLFHPAPTMRVLSRDITDPRALAPTGKTGVLNIIDLANLHTISFIATEDLGRVYTDHSFEVLGRMDASIARGCNLLLEDIAGK